MVSDLNIDSSVLESYHVSQAFKLLKKQECNMLENFPGEQFRTIRRRMIDCVLATDMANHSKQYANLKTKVESSEIRNGVNVEKLLSDSKDKKFENQQLVLNAIIHASDISNPAKPEKLYDEWVKLLFAEFFNQGDFEKNNNLPISLLCDRNTTNVDKAQIGFINFIVVPLWDVVFNIVPEAAPYMDNIKTNLKRYEEIVREKERENEKK